MRAVRTSRELFLNGFIASSTTEQKKTTKRKVRDQGRGTTRVQKKSYYQLSQQLQPKFLTVDRNSRGRRSLSASDALNIGKSHFSGDLLSALSSHRLCAGALDASNQRWE